MSEFGPETAVCIDPKLRDVRNGAVAAPGNPLIYGRYLGQTDETIAARLKAAGVTHLTTHEECGMAKLYADTTHPTTKGSSNPQLAADLLAETETIRFAKTHKLAHTHIKGIYCPSCDNSRTHIFRIGAKTMPSTGFKIDEIVAPNPEVAAGIANAVGHSRGFVNRIDVIVAPNEGDARTLRRSLDTINPNTIKQVIVSK